MKGAERNPIQLHFINQIDFDAVNAVKFGLGKEAIKGRW